MGIAKTTKTITQKTLNVAYTGLQVGWLCVRIIKAKCNK